MKIKNIIILALILTFIVSFGAAAQEFEDVPRDHWAYDSVQTLAERGYLSLYAGEDFDGDESVTRYELAEIIANILDNMIAGGGELTEEDVDIIRELSLEFRDELVSVAQNQREFEDRIKEVEDQAKIQDEDISDVNIRVSELQEELSILSNQIDTLASLEDQLEDDETLGDIQERQRMSLSRLDDLESRVAQLETGVDPDDADLRGRAGLDSINTGYIIGGLALLALIL
ncbi:S-layer homology domain-containing protein [Halanaerobium sp. Z-7514]|uniref:S-layer homology domain-containing protein n=1 Tax=Halanaerobium polyolivorans TaxID=2886943 RepID=A0AAW4WW91_9FIRM|nr:S-layer homology domain-containing protein [Halanaerobium polyolivorans]MCC3143898.1 S-layer homology domain-containing protein [Halanaerobium polyolivorans]